MALKLHRCPATFLTTSGQRALPAIEFEDGAYLREESAELAARIKEGRLTPDGSEAT
jgi:hypothetical protein